MPGQPILDRANFVAQAEKEKWDKDRAVHKAYEWCEQTYAIRRALNTAESDNVALVAVNDFLVDLVRQSDMAHLLAPEAIEQSLPVYLAARLQRLDDAESIERQGMELNANLAATTAVSEKQRHAASGPRSRSPNSAKTRVTDAMRIWRRSNSGGTLSNFLATVAAANDSYEFRISELNSGKYAVDCEGGDEADDGKKVSWRTLEDWWQKSATKKQ
jgi:hypothetical protein